MKPYRNENLIKFSDMSPELHQILSSRGGVVSGQKRREKAALRLVMNEAWESILITNGWIDDIKAYRLWIKRRDKARRKREQTTEK